jgi:radical SAM protein with 4Fe4S-binding SPASM domain
MFLNITGGEPLLRDDIFKIIKKAVDMNFYLKLFSSLYTADKNKLDMLYEKGLREIDVSLYGRERIHNQITGSDSFTRTINNIKIARDIGFKFTVKRPAMKQNLSELEWIYDYTERNNLKFHIDPLITPADDGRIINEGLQLNKKELLKIINNSKFYRAENNNNSSESIKKYFACGAMRNVLGINFCGDVYPCLAYPLKVGNIRNALLKDILESDKADEIRKMLKEEPDKCVKCSYKNYCSRCAGVAYLYGDELSVYSSSCDIARAQAGKE